MNYKRVSLALCLALTLGLLSSCGGGNSSSSANSSGSTGGQVTDVLYHAYHSTPYVTLDPSTEYSNGILVLQNVYETLTYYNDKTGELDPLLATSWTSNEDGTVWTFQLRDDVTFHDGTPMTSADVKASLERTISLGQGAAYNWDAVDSIETNGDYEVIINCSAPAPIDLIASSGYAGYVMSAEAVQQDTEWFNAGNDGGTGPYTIAQTTGKDNIVLKAYEDYRGGWADNQYKTVLIKSITESSARRQMLETGEAQLSENFSSTDLDALRANTSTLYSYQSDTWNNAIAFLNCQKAPCDNEDFRKALQYSFPYQDTVTGVMAGNAVQSVGLVPNGMWAHDPTLTQYTTDMDKAKESLAASGVDTSNLTLSATYSSGYDEYSSILQLWQANLRELGITLEIRGMEWDAQWDEAKASDPNNRQDILLMRWWPDYASPSSWFDALVRSEETVSFNLAYINDPELDQMIETADNAVATNRDLAQQTYIEIQKKLIESAPMINMFDDSHTYIVSKTISGVEENPAYSTVVHYYNVTKNS